MNSFVKAIVLLLAVSAKASEVVEPSDSAAEVALDAATFEEELAAVDAVEDEAVFRSPTALQSNPRPSPTRRRPTRRPSRRPTRNPTRRPTRRPSGGGSTRCVDDDRPRPVRNGQRFRFNLDGGGDAQCVDQDRQLYEYGQGGGIRTFSACAEYCVNDVPNSLATGGNFRGFDFDCDRSTCRCLYDEGTLDSRNSGRFDRTNRNEPGYGSISGTTRRSGIYCGNLVGAEFVEEAVAEA